MQRVVRGLAPGGVGPCRAGGAVERGEVFDGGGEVGHDFQIIEKLYGVATQLLCGHITGRVDLHSGYPEHPKNCAPAFDPCRVVRTTIGLPHA